MQIWGVVVTNIISNLVLNKLAMFKGIVLAKDNTGF